MRLGPCILLIAWAAYGNAFVNPWIKTYGSGARDEARLLASDGQGNLVMVYSTAGRPTVARLTPDGAVLWSRTLGPCEVAGVKVDYALVYLGVNSSGPGGVSRASLDALSLRDGSTVWQTAPFGQLPFESSSVSDLGQVGVGIYVGGEVDGQAAVSYLRNGAVLHCSSIPGRNIRLGGRAFVTERDGKGWFGTLSFIGEVELLRNVGVFDVPTGRVSNLRVSSDEPGRTLTVWVTGDVSTAEGGRDAFGFLYDALNRRPMGSRRFVSTSIDTVVDAYRGWADPAANRFQVRTILRSTDPGGRSRYSLHAFGWGALASTHTDVPIVAERLDSGVVAGSACLVRRGWDIALLSANGEPLAYDGGSQSDDVLAGLVQTSSASHEGALFALATTYRFGRSSVRLLKLQRIDLGWHMDGARKVGVDVRLPFPAPSGGINVDLSSSSQSAVALSARVHIPAGAQVATVPAAATRVSNYTEVPVTVRQGGNTWTTILKLWPD